MIIEKESDIHTTDFREEILSSGYVLFYNDKDKDKRNIKIECINKEMQNPNKYNCLLLNGK